MSKPTNSYLVSLLLFGSNGIIASHIQANSLSIVLYRCILGFAGLLVCMILSAERPSATKSQKLWMFLSGVFMGLGWDAADPR